MTPFATMLRLAGLSIGEASEFHRVPPNTVKSWSSGRRTCPTGVIEELRNLIARQRDAAAAVIETINAAKPEQSGIEKIEIGYPADDHEARSMGWPCAAAWGAIAARVVAESPVPIALVPRGATPATAAAADIRDAADATRAD
ncbi:hypothetical protein SAMN02745172_02444 [Pseudoxanthobacter soli DSM 19599]|uniref:Uncharacterized protein n=1 Tax=Pseudoxanthobacter soli DSM 19599 TaxID=1123029 RepID=A0A1M7ZLN5_9HYPH|nr:hypothetical protein [Pseudoxanthobacter soli]SHO65797.1 hypothetical protein SAMN02745172_02444 [Pseudoxanthobacter soli DSM 19599]